jgi:hypothetical protein
MKSAMMEWEILGKIDLFGAVPDILNGIADAELQRAFRSWIGGVEKVINVEEDFLPQ